MVGDLIARASAPYSDPLFLPFLVGGTLVSAGAFLLLAIPLTWLAWRTPASLERYRIQARRPSDPGRMVREGLRAVAVNHAWMAAWVSVNWPLLQSLDRIHAGPRPAWPVVVLQLIVLFYLHDLLYHFFHRALHEQPWMWKNVHRLHHRIGTPWSIAGYDFHPIEFCLSGSVTLAGPLLLGVHVHVLWLWIALRAFDAAEGHSGYNLPLSPLYWLPGADGPRAHDAHHSTGTGNFASYLGWSDRLFGTLSRGYQPGRSLPPRGGAQGGAPDAAPVTSASDNTTGL